MGVEPKIGMFSPPEWMVKIMENPIKMDDLGGTPIFGNTHIFDKGSKISTQTFLYDSYWEGATPKIWQTGPRTDRYKWSDMGPL